MAKANQPQQQSPRPQTPRGIGQIPGVSSFTPASTDVANPGAANLANLTTPSATTPSPAPTSNIPGSSPNKPTGIGGPDSIPAPSTPALRGPTASSFTPNKLTFRPTTSDVTTVSPKPTLTGSGGPLPATGIVPNAGTSPNAGPTQVRTGAVNFGNVVGSQENTGLYGGGPFGTTGMVPTYMQLYNNTIDPLSYANAGYQGIINSGSGGYGPGGPQLFQDEANEVTTGGYDPAQLANLKALYDLYGPTGGFDPNQLQYLQDIGQGFVQTGGYDPDQISNIRSGYQSFADTGGFTPQQESAFLTRATQPVEGTYNVLQNQAMQARAATGGLGLGGQYSQMARQLGQTASDAAVNAETQLTAQENANKLAGLGGLQTVDQSQAANRLTALGQLGGLSSAEATGVRDLTNQQQNLLSGEAAGSRAGVSAEAGTQSDIAHGNEAAIAGEAGLYNSTTGAFTAEGQQILQFLGLTNQAEETQLAILAGLANSPGTFSKVLQAIKVAGGATAGILGATP